MSTYPAAVAADAPLLYWRLDDTAGTVAADTSSGALRPGTYSGTYALGAAALIDAGTALDLRTSPGGTVIRTDATWIPATFSVECWAQRAGAPHSASAGGYLLARDQVAGSFAQRSWYVEWTSTDTLTFRGFAGSAQRFNISAPIAAAGTHHIVATYDGVTARLYLDGAQVASAAAAGGALNNAQSFSAGAAASTLSSDWRRFNGLIDEVAVYTGALTAERVAAHYAAGTAPPPPPPPPPVPVPDNGAPFQWHSPDPAAVDGTGWVVDEARTAALIGYTTTRGRENPTTKPTPAAVTLELDSRLAAAPELGDLFRIVTAPAIWGTDVDSLERVRVTAEVTDVVHEVAAHRINVTAVGRLARHGRRLLDLRGRGQQLEGAAVTRILDAADLPAGDVDAGVVTLLPPTDPATAGALLDAVADSTLGLVVERRDGAVDYQAADHRRGAVPVLTLAAGDLELAGFTWAKRTSALVTEVTIGYGTGSAQVHVALEGEDQYPTNLTTQLVDASAAYDLAATILGRYALPAWQLPTVPVNLHRVVVDPAARAAVLRLDVSDRLTLTGLPAGGLGPDTDVFVEQITESVRVVIPHRLAPDLPVEARTAWSFAFGVSDPTTSGVTFRWSDVPDAVTWAGVVPDLSWLQLARAENPDTLTTP